jgi:hypothetical protein
LEDEKYLDNQSAADSLKQQHETTVDSLLRDDRRRGIDSLGIELKQQIDSLPPPTIEEPKRNPRKE